MLFSHELNSQRIFKRLAKALISLRHCAGWSEPLLVTHTTLLEISCHGSYIILLLFMPPKELWEAYSNRTVRPSVCPSRFRVRSISPIFFEVGIPNLVCGYILGWGSVLYHFRVTVTLTSDLVFRIILSGAYLLYYLR